MKPKINRPIVPAILAMAGAVLFTTSGWVSAQSTITTNPGDLILAFSATNSTLLGYTTNLTVDLGSPSLFYNGAGTGETFSLSELVVADLVAAYGENWYTRADLQWGVLGGYPSTYSGPGGIPPQWTLFASSPENASGTSIAWNSAVTTGIGAYSHNAQNTPAQAISAIAGYAGNQSVLGSLNGSTSTANSTSAATISTAEAYSWTSISNGAGGAAGTFGYFSSSIENNADIQDSASGFIASDLYELLPVAQGGKATPGELLGAFELSESGLTFIETPEPASYALLAAGAGILLIARKRGKRPPHSSIES